MTSGETIAWPEVERHFPAPIALASRRYNSCAEDQDPTRKLICLFSALETVLRYLCYVLSADSLSQRRDPSEKASVPEWLTDLQVNKGLSLGEWVGAFRESSASLDPDGAFMPEALRLWQEGEVSRTIEDLVAARNQFLHVSGAIAWTDEEVREFLAAAKPRLPVLMGHLSFLRDYPLCIAIAGSVFGTAPGQPSSSNEYTLLRCMGAYGDSWPRSPHLVLDQPVRAEHPFVLNPECTELLYLWPFLADGESELLQDHELYVFEHQRARCLTEAAYSAVRAREEITRSWAPGADGYSWLVGRVAGLPGRTTLSAPCQLMEGLREPREHLEGLVVGATRRYHLRRRIGEGSMGAVYDAQDDIGRRYAVKVLHPHLPPAFLRRFEREIRSLEVLRGQPNILLLLDWGVHSRPAEHDLHYCVTEFAERGDLDTHLEYHCGPPGDDREIPAPEQLATRLSLYVQLVGGVAQMHRQGFVHRDLKPSNALVMGDGTVRVGDMGVVKLLDPQALGATLTSRGSVVGSLGYMAPEQQLGHSELVDESTDVFALGIILFEVIFGRLPRRDADRPDDVLLEQQALSELPRPLRRVILKCTKKQQQARYKDAMQLLEALGPGIEQLLAGTVSIETEPPGAQVFIDGDPAPPGKLEFELPAGEHVITARLPGHAEGPRHLIRVIARKREAVSVDARPVFDELAERRRRAPTGREVVDAYLERMDLHMGLRRAAYGLLEEIFDRNSIDIWREMVEEHGSDVIPDLVEALETEDRDAQAKLVRLITHWGEPRYLQSYLAQVHRSVIPRCPRAVKGLWLEFLLHDPETSVAQLLDVLSREPDQRLKLSVSAALGRSERPGVQEALVACIDGEPSVAVRRETVKALDARNPDSRVALARLLRQDPDSAVRLQCALKLGEAREPDCFDCLLTAVRTDADAPTRAAAINALLRTAPERARAALMDIIDEGDTVVIESLRSALRQAGGPALEDYLAQAECDIEGGPD